MRNMLTMLFLFLLLAGAHTGHAEYCKSTFVLNDYYLHLFKQDWDTWRLSINPNADDLVRFEALLGKDESYIEYFLFEDDLVGKEYTIEKTKEGTISFLNSEPYSVSTDFLISSNGLSQSLPSVRSLRISSKHSLRHLDSFSKHLQNVRFLEFMSNDMSISQMIQLVHCFPKVCHIVLPKGADALCYLPVFSAAKLLRYIDIDIASVASFREDIGSAFKIKLQGIRIRLLDLSTDDRKSAALCQFISKLCTDAQEIFICEIRKETGRYQSLEVIMKKIFSKKELSSLSLPIIKKEVLYYMKEYGSRLFEKMHYLSLHNYEFLEMNEMIAPKLEFIRIHSLAQDSSLSCFPELIGCSLGNYHGRKIPTGVVALEIFSFFAKQKSLEVLCSLRGMKYLSIQNWHQGNELKKKDIHFRYLRGFCLGRCTFEGVEDKVKMFGEILEFANVKSLKYAYLGDRRYLTPDSIKNLPLATMVEIVLRQRVTLQVLLVLRKLGCASLRIVNTY